MSFSGPPNDPGLPTTSLTPTVRTPAAGFALQNGTPTILSFTTPNDGQAHGYSVATTLNVTVAETGGAVQLTWTSQGVAFAATVYAGGSGTGTNNVNSACVADPNTVVTLKQSTALTAGTASVAAAISGG
jgi:hypothetical protein